MAKIILIGNREVETDREKGLRIKEIWQDKKRWQEMIDVGDLSFYPNQIRAIYLDPLAQEAKLMFDVNIPSVRQMIRDFEKELKEYEYPAFDRWCVAKGYLLNPIYREYTRPDGTKYTKPESTQCRSDINVAWEMDKALKVLQAKTNFAQKMELENLNSLKEDLKDKMEMPEIVDEELDKLF